MHQGLSEMKQAIDYVARPVLLLTSLKMMVTEDVYCDAIQPATVMSKLVLIMLQTALILIFAYVTKIHIAVQ